MTSTAVLPHQGTFPTTHATRLVWLILRRDRVRLVIWLACFVMLAWGVGLAEKGLVADPASAQARAQIMATPTGIAFGGPGYGLANYTLGVTMANEMLMMSMLMAAIMSILLVVRWTRADEDSGRFELVGAAAVGRYAPLTAGLVVLVGLNVAIGLGSCAGLMALGLELAGSAAYGASLALAGVGFGAVGALTAQVFSTARGAGGAAMALMGALYMVRVAGDIGHAQFQPGQPAGSGLSWLSPFAWPTQTRLFVELRWWPLLLNLAFALVVTALALYFQAHRDLGAGLIQPKPGRARAKASLRTPLALTIRLERGALISWAIGGAVLGGSVGAMDLTSYLDSMVAENPAIAQVIGSDGRPLADAFFGLVMFYGALLAVAYALGAIGRLRAAESGGHLELELSTATPRRTAMGAAVAAAAVGGALIAAVTGLTAGAAAGVSGNGSFGAIAGAGLAQVPSVLAYVGLAAALYGLAPRLSGLAWALMAYGALAKWLGGVLKLPSWVASLGGFPATPNTMAAGWSVRPLVVMTAVGLALMALGVTAFQRRDLQTG
jgi:ABC-2 type transport system permease protein